MGLYCMVTDASGRATCKLCNKKIEKGQKQVTITGYRTNASIHRNEKDCEVE